MKKFYLSIFLTVSILSFGQIHAPEGLNMPGTWNLNPSPPPPWLNPPSNPAIGGVQVSGGRIQIKTGLGTSIYQTIFSVASSGGDLVGGNYQWLFTSGPLATPYANKWANVAVSMNTEQTYLYNSGPDNTVTLTNGKWYTVNFRNIGYTNTQAIFMETSGEPRTITAVSTSQPLTSVFPGEQTITITLSGTPAADEYFYLRWTTDAFATSNITPFVISGTTGTATINVLPNQSIAFYVFSSSIGTITGGESSLFYDLRTIHFNNNSGPNYTFTVQPAYRTIATTGTLTYTNASTWRGNVVPPSGARIQVEDNVELDAKHLLLTLDSIELIGTGKIDLTNAWVDFVNDAALIGIPSNFITGSTTQFRFLGTGRLPANFYMNGDLIIEGNLILGTNVTVGRSLIIRTGGFVSNNAPVYAYNSSLQYHSPSYNVSLEWSHPGTGVLGTDAGYPFTVVIGDGNNATTVNFTNLNRAAENQLIIQNGSTFNFTNTTVSSDLIFLGGITVNGTLNMNNSNRKIITEGQVIINASGIFNLSTVIGGDLEIKNVGGGIQKAVGGVLNTNNRAIFFTNNTTGIQYFQGSDFTLDYIIIDNASIGVQFGTGTENITIRKNGFISTANSSNVIVNGNLILQADATEYAKLLLCITCSISGSGTITRQTFFPAGAANTNPLSSDFNDGKNGRWFSIGFPMPGVAMNQFDGGSPAFFAAASPLPIARWNPNTGDYVYPTNIGTETFLPNQGYVIYMGENQHGIVTRNLTTQNLVNVQMNVANPSPNVSLGYTSTPSFTNIIGSHIDGWNLIVNPYLAPLNLQSTTFSNAVGTAYIYNPTTGNFTTYNFSDPTPFYIAPLQAFWIRATNNIGGSVSFIPANQSSSLNPAQAKPQISIDHAWLKLSRADGSSDELRIYFRSEATDGYDNTYDSEKLKGDPARISFYTFAGNKPLAVDSRGMITSNKQIPIHVYCGNPSVMTIELEALGLPTGYHAWLEDHVTGQFVKIEDGAYTFFQQVSGHHHRFTLHIAEQIIGLCENNHLNSSQVWTTGEKLHILLGADALRGEFSVIDMTGKRVFERKFNGVTGQHLIFDLNFLRHGVYVLKTHINGVEKTLKFVR